MGEPKPTEDFEATEYDENGNILLPPPPIEAAKPKRPTVAGLKKELDELKADVEESVLSWLGELAIRLEKIEEGSLSDRTDVAADISARLDNQDAAIGALADALRSHLEELAATPQPPETELEFAQPPQQRAGGQANVCDIAAVASVCLTMNDVLMICRALKEIPELTDTERIKIVSLACRSSGVFITPGLQIRAGVKFTGA